MSDGLFLGRSPQSSEAIRLKSKDLRTHGIVVGMTGSGKTGLSLVLLEELINEGIPIIAIDPKGDLGNLALLFPDLAPDQFEPWVGEKNPMAVSLRWRAGLSKWDLKTEDVAALHGKASFTVYTPGSEAGVGVNLLGSFGRPSPGILADGEARRELVAGTVSGLLGLVGQKVDPVKDPAHIVLSRILNDAWLGGEDPTLETLILRLVDPPFSKVGVFPLDRFFTPDERMDLAMTLNGVLASPSFKPWTQGRSLDIDGMLKPGPKTPVHIFSLAHLGESERQFFLSLLLGQLMAWSRQQPGTESLRAVLFFDEVAGYLPPYPKNPPTKAPLLTMMKQARAVGLGVVLATQNPVDLDYKAVSNAGLWCIGRLSTKQDRERLLKGIDGAGLDDTVAALEKRQFLIHQVGKATPRVVASRHAMCYLRGPFTRVEIKRLNALHGVESTAKLAAAPIGTAPSPVAAPRAGVEPGGLPMPPVVRGFDQLFVDPRRVFSAHLASHFTPFAEAHRPDGKILFRPALYAELNLRFDEDRMGFVEDYKAHRLWFPLGNEQRDAFLQIPFEDGDLRGEAYEGAYYADLPEWLDEAKELRALKKQIVEDVYRSETRGMFVNAKFKLYGKPGETRAEFEGRCEAAAEDKADAAIAKLKDRYETKADRLEERIRKAQARLGELESAAKGRQLQEVVGIGETIFALFSGRKRSLSRTMSRRRQTSQAGARVDKIEGDLESLREDVLDLEAELAGKIEDIEDNARALIEMTVEKEVRLEKNDITLKRFGIVWVPVTRRV